MARVNLLNNQTLNNTPVTDNGTFVLYESPKIDRPNSDRGLEVVVTYKNPVPDPETGGTNFRIACELETEDNQGNWYPFHTQFQSFFKPEVQGGQQVHTLRVDPSIFLLDKGVVNLIPNPDGTSANIESLKQGIAPDDFRIKILVSENGFGGLKPFQSVDVTVSYFTYPV